MIVGAGQGHFIVGDVDGVDTGIATTVGAALHSSTTGPVSGTAFITRSDSICREGRAGAVLEDRRWGDRA